MKRSTIGEAWGTQDLGGERSVAAADEDAVTMAVEAAVTATVSIPTDTIDALIFASTTSPYLEKQAAATVAAVLDCRKDILTLDVADSLRGATTALLLSADRILAGSARVVVVCAADSRLGEPASSFEQMFGDAGAAVVLASEEAAAELKLGPLPVVLEGTVTSAQEFVGPWRTERDRFVRSFDSKPETRYGFAAPVVAAAQSLLDKAGVNGQDLSRAVIAAPDPRAQAAVANQLGISRDAVEDLHLSTVGNTGAAAPLLMLAGALERAGAGETILLVGAGDGADALLLRTTVALADVGCFGLTPYLEAKGYLDSYEQYAGYRSLMVGERPDVLSSAITHWRDMEMALPLYGMTCRECGTRQYPIGRRCMECGGSGPHPSARLERRGRVFTFTLDHLVLGEYRNVPVIRAVIDLEGGGRIFCELTDCDPEDVHIEMPVELTFRCLHEGAKFRNYYWKGRPLRAMRPARTLA